MTTGGVGTHPGRCPACSGSVGPADNYCLHCRAPLTTASSPPGNWWEATGATTTPTSPAPATPQTPAIWQTTPTTPPGPPGPPGPPATPSPPQPAPATRSEDGTTRYLCAAAQLDDEFADDAITEYLVESTRAVPPTPGVDVAAVLREAVAARARRRIRDIILVALLLVLLLVDPLLLLLWLGVALVARGAALGGRLTTGRRVLDWVIGLLILGPVAALVLVSIVAIAFSSALSGAYGGGYDYGTSPYGNPLGLAVATLLIVLLLLLAISAVVVVDTATVHWLVTDRFRRGNFLHDFRQAVSPWEQRVRGLGQARFNAALHRVAVTEQRQQGTAAVVVHRGYRPFVGGGARAASRNLALRLEPADDSANAAALDPIRVSELHEHVAAALGALRTPSSLSPERRLEELTGSELVLAPADLLVGQLGSDLLPRIDWPPVPGVSAMAARQLAEWPREWARYYRCYRIESWNRELATSCYFTAGTDQHTLYVEWSHCVLLPLRRRFRDIDRVVPVGQGPIARSLVEMVLLPLSVVRRFRSAVRQFRPIFQRPGEIVADRYGAGASVRELAADTGVQAYFQELDVVRYVKVVEGALVRAIGEYLEERGYSIVEFQRAASSVTMNMTNVHGGSFFNSTVGSGQFNGATPGAGPEKERG